MMTNATRRTLTMLALTAALLTGHVARPMPARESVTTEEVAR